MSKALAVNATVSGRQGFFDFLYKWGKMCIRDRLITNLTLLRLPQLPPPPQPREHPLRALLAGPWKCRRPV